MYPIIIAIYLLELLQPVAKTLASSKGEGLVLLKKRVFPSWVSKILIFSKSSFFNASRMFKLLAKPGEFTLRAFLNGKMDLSQARRGVFLDYDNDDWIDLIVVGEFMPIQVFHNEEEKLRTI